MPSGAWRAQAKLSGSEMLNTRDWALDPEHKNPTPNPGARHNSWDAAQGMSATPSGITTVQDSWSVDESRAVYLDRTPEDHDEGMAPGPGLTIPESMAQNAAARSRDLGATIARRFASPRRDDGEYRAELETQPLYNAGNPESLILQQQSDPSMSPNARAGNRVARAMHRVFQTMRWEPDHRPLYLTNAFVDRDTPAAKGGAFASSPFSSLARVVRDGPAAPQLRRTPPSWDDSQLVDGTDAVQDYGFQSWGL